MAVGIGDQQTSNYVIMFGRHMVKENAAVMMSCNKETPTESDQSKPPEGVILVQLGVL